MNFEPLLHPEWKEVLSGEFEKEYFVKLSAFLDEEEKQGKIIFPQKENIFSAFNNTLFKNVKVVIFGQDPYHGPGQAHGMCFSVPNGIKPPPSLVNIFKEIKNDLNLPVPDNGYLMKWAEQGIFLLNTILTVEKGKPLSHKGKGWEIFNTEVIKKISDKDSPVVFLLWGKEAREYAKLIDENKHFILTASHPAAEAYSNKGGFFGCKHFSKTNEILRSLGNKPVDWGN